jgi:hypothetical protein
MIPLRVVLDDWAQPPEPEPPAVSTMQFKPGGGQFRRQLMMDTALAASLPSPLILVTGV